MAESRNDHNLTRRRVLGGAALGAGALLAGRLPAAAQSTPESTPTTVNGDQPDGSWAYTDDRGVTVTLPKRPARIVAQTTAASALWDYGFEVVGVIGPNKLADGTNDFQAGDIDFSKVEVLGDYGTDSLEIDFEKLTALAPDLVIDLTYGEGVLWYIESVKDTVQKIAPTFGFSMEKISILTIAERIEAFAAALGADQNAAPIAAAKAEFEEAQTAFKAAIEAKPGLTTLVCSFSADLFYVASPDWMVDLRYFADLGMDVVRHHTDNFFESVSWEQAGNYPADLILVDQRPGQEQIDALQQNKVWTALPAVIAGQVGPWYAAAPYSHARLTPIIKEMTEIVSTSRADVV